MILLGINCGLGNTDCSELPIGAVNLARGWLTYPRTKTMVMRECPLCRRLSWRFRKVLRVRRQPATPDLNHFVFLTVFAESHG